MKLKNRVPFNLQFFADGGEGDTGTGGAEGSQGNEGANATEGETKTFDDLLKDKAYQSEFDKRVAKALETAKGKWQTEQQKAIEDAKTEAEKLAKMNAEQKAQYEKEKQEADFNKRLAELNQRELKATAKETLSEKGLPLELAEVLNYADADACNKSIETVEKVFQQAVEKVVNEKLRGNGAPKSGSSANSTLEDQIAKAVRGQI